MKRIAHYILIIAITLSTLGIVTMTSCSGFLNERSNDLAYIHTADDLDELLIGSCYLSVAPTTPRKYESYYFSYLQYMADETEELIGNTRYNPEANIRPRVFGYYTWQQHVGDAFDGLKSYKESIDWLRVYNHILNLNIVLDESERIDTSTVADQNRIKRIKAEAHFLRAAYYFQLVNLYALPYAPENLDKPGVPLKDSHFIEKKKFTRATIGEVYAQISNDLTLAIKEIEGQPTRSLYRISEAGVLLFASRVALYMQEWQRAEEYASKALSLHPTLCNLNALGVDSYFFSVDNPELIFSMGGGLVCAEMGSSSPIGGFSVSKELYQLYNKDDLRGTRFIERIKVKGAQPNGYQLRACKTTPKLMGKSEVSDVFVLRSAEIYLNLAEALAMQGKSAETVRLLKQLHQNRYKVGAALPDIDTSPKGLINEIRKERRMELCFESQRWFDIRRYRVQSQSPEKIELTHTYTIYKKEGRNSFPDVTYFYTLPANEDEGYVLPLPREERTFNDIIQDNPRIERKPTKIIQHETK